MIFTSSFFYILIFTISLINRRFKHMLSEQLTRLSPSAHLATSEEFFIFETFTDALGMILNDSPNTHLDFRLCNAFHFLVSGFVHSQIISFKFIKLPKTRYYFTSFFQVLLLHQLLVLFSI